MNNVACEYYAQAERFIVLAQLATQHMNEEISKPENSDKQNDVRTFEGVSVAFCHGFALEMLLKGIMVCKKISKIPKTHDLKKLLEHCGLNDLKNELIIGWTKTPDFVKCLEDSSNLFGGGRYFFEPNATAIPPNATFTSYMCNYLRCHLKKLLQS